MTSENIQLINSTLKEFHNSSGEVVNPFFELGYHEKKVDAIEMYHKLFNKIDALVIEFPNLEYVKHIDSDLLYLANYFWNGGDTSEIWKTLK